jgi:hypothetical protein
MAWFGEDFVNFAKIKWGGRNRPVTGGGATEHVGAIGQGALADAYAIAAQWQPPSFASIVSTNPHPMPGNHVITDMDGHAPALKAFNNLGIASRTAFHPG